VARDVLTQHAANEDPDTILCTQGTVDGLPHAELVDMHLQVILRWVDLYNHEIGKQDLMDIWR
jgi:hypothetical protein